MVGSMPQGGRVRVERHLPWSWGPGGGPTSHSSGRGGQRWFVAQWSKRGSGEVSPPPLSVGRSVPVYEQVKHQ